MRQTNLIQWVFIDFIWRNSVLRELDTNECVAAFRIQLSVVPFPLLAVGITETESSTSEIKLVFVDINQMASLLNFEPGNHYWIIVSAGNFFTCFKDHRFTPLYQRLRIVVETVIVMICNQIKIFSCNFSFVVRSSPPVLSDSTYLCFFPSPQEWCIGKKTSSSRST